MEKNCYNTVTNDAWGWFIDIDAPLPPVRERNYYIQGIATIEEEIDDETNDDNCFDIMEKKIRWILDPICTIALLFVIIQLGLI